jgi:molybdenum cofactor cytidylyltransferase
MMARTLKVAAIVLAAGRSLRMSPRNKLLELVKGKPVIVHVVDAALRSGAEAVIVVTGFEARRLEEAMRGSNVTIAHNAYYEQGLSATIQTGLEALPPNIDGALILLGDMPEIESKDLRALIAAFTARDGQGICVPVRHGSRGNPVLWGACYFAEMMALSGDVGAKQLLARHAENVVEVPVSSDGIFVDVDTAADMERLQTKR